MSYLALLCLKYFPNLLQVNFHKCVESFPDVGCGIFTGSESVRASTVSLSILVMIEMFNALNSISENQSLLKLPPSKNMKLVYSIIISLLLHMLIIYIPYFSVSDAIFGYYPIRCTDALS